MIDPVIEKQARLEQLRHGKSAAVRLEPVFHTKSDIRILRVDPVKRAIASMKIRVGKNAMPEVRRLCRAKKVGWREILDVDGTVLVVAGGLEIDEAMQGWRIRGTEDTAGIGVLFGKGPHGGMVDCPATPAWLQDRIIWLDGEDVVGRQERAESMLPSLEPEIRMALAMAMPSANGDMWVPMDFVHLFPAILALGIGTPSTNGQRLSPVGVTIHELLLEEAR